MNYHRLGFAVSFIIHLLFVALAFYIKKPVAQENMEAVLEFNVANIIKTGEHETDKNTMKTSKDIESEMSVPAMVKQETKNTIEEKIEQEEQEITYSAEYLKTQIGEMPIHDEVKQEAKIKTEDNILTKAEEVTKKVKKIADTKRVSEGTANFDMRGQSGGIPKSESMPHELKQSVANQYIKEHFDYINKLIRINITYPYKARKRLMEGETIITFIVRLDGSVIDIKIEKSSGFLTLDNNAVEAVRMAAPFPAPSAEVKVVIPIKYKLNT